MTLKNGTSWNEESARANDLLASCQFNVMCTHYLFHSPALVIKLKSSPHSRQLPAKTLPIERLEHSFAVGFFNVAPRKDVYAVIAQGTTGPLGWIKITPDLAAPRETPSLVASGHVAFKICHVKR